jgi:3-oxoacyl-[acyl-carrier protein] reductase
MDSPPGRAVTRQLGVPEATDLRRYEPGQPLLAGPALLGGAGPLHDAARAALHAAGATVLDVAPDDDCRLAALVFDAGELRTPADLRGLYEFFHPTVRRLERSGRLIVLGRPPAGADAVAQRALEGFVRAVAKELRGGATAQLLQVAPGAEADLASPLRFLLSARSAYVDGQVLRVDGSGRGSASGSPTPADHDRPQVGRVALVTGASRGIGAAIAEVLARDGAHVVCLDVPAQGEALAAVANRVGGTALQLDVTADDAPARLVEHLTARHGGVDVVVHNAGITRDRTLGRMSDAEWDVLLAVNLTAPQRLTEALLHAGTLNEAGRIVCVSSVSAVAGNRGQVNYATAKAGLIGLVQGLSPQLPAGRTINAVAPGFIETEMTQAMPLFTREAGRRMNSLSQGGRPVDVAEAIAWFGAPDAGGVTGQVLRVCGQSLIGA